MRGQNVAALTLCQENVEHHYVKRIKMKNVLLAPTALSPIGHKQKDRHCAVNLTKYEAEYACVIFCNEYFNV